MNQPSGNKLLYSERDYPIFQNRMYETREAAVTCTRGDITLVEDQTTGLVYNSSFDPSLVSYTTHYQNEQANSISFRVHLEMVADLIERHMGLRNLIEVGCGKGTFLRMLADRGAGIIGFDPTYEGDSDQIQKEYFGPEIALHAEGLILRHVLEHIQDPFDFLCQLRDSNGGQGSIYIEVPCLDWICNNRAWYDLFYEHVNYFRLSDFLKMFGNIIASGRCFGGQYLYIIADLESLTPPRYDAKTSFEFPVDFKPDLSLSRDDTDALDIVWGGASKGVIYSLLRERAGKPVDGIIDVNPAKQGKFLAATGLRVSSPGDILPTLPKDSRIIVMNPNYLEEIKQMSNNVFNYVEVGHV